MNLGNEPFATVLGRAAAKMEAMRDCGIHVAESPAALGSTLAVPIVSAAALLAGSGRLD